MSAANPKLSRLMKSLPDPGGSIAARGAMTIGLLPDAAPAPARMNVRLR
ncbi:MAG: hypothetical protein AVDCRST_MAG23-1886 [uncultured Sphingosinicella sp.]|uniref:Uncharacterized protein n=1 Tax=uncultured Sphingosinicella sp. TaxID=478748 RepID=A0A6J4TYZ7_9SPHN|nr:MAG: hypothetical protein AVDCRST_MAG23-1886 [uncultured Sphingosinicella sp.]